MALITLQAAWPIFTPRVSIVEAKQLLGYIDVENNITTVNYETQILMRPPLLSLGYPPPGACTDIPLNYGIEWISLGSLSQFKYVNVYTDKSKNSFRFCTTVTGWQYDTIGGVIRYALKQPSERYSISNIDGFYDYENMYLDKTGYYSNFTIVNRNKYSVVFQNIFNYMSDYTCEELLSKFKKLNTTQFEVFVEHDDGRGLSRAYIIKDNVTNIYIKKKDILDGCNKIKLKFGRSFKIEPLSHKDVCVVFIPK